MNGPYVLGCHGCHTAFRNDVRRPLFAVANRQREEAVRAAARRGAIRHVHGPASVDLGPEELVVLCLGRDAELWVPSFVEHHLALGAAHIVFLDNGSEDRTVELLSRYRRVTVLRTDLSFARYEVGLRRWLVRTFAQGRWSLVCDADELWDYPYSDRLPLAAFLRYLRTHGYKAVLGQMLDMFSDLPLNAIQSRPEDSLRDRYRYYDTSDLRWTRDVYWIRDGQAANPELACIFGGIRKRFFGDGCLLLSKHSLIFADDTVGVFSYDGHFAARAPVADISTVLLHYKYVGTLGERVIRSVHWHKQSTALYGGLHDVLARQPDLCLRLDTARELHHTRELVENGFLTVTDQYRRWVERHGRAAPAGGAVAVLARTPDALP